MKTNSILSTIFAFSLLFLFSCSENLNETANSNLKGTYDLNSFQINKEEQLIAGIKSTMEFDAQSKSGGTVTFVITPPIGESSTQTNPYIITEDGTFITIGTDKLNLNLKNDNLTIDGKSGDDEIIFKGTRK